jgi:hypothetical protein
MKSPTDDQPQSDQYQFLQDSSYLTHILSEQRGVGAEVKIRDQDNPKAEEHARLKAELEREQEREIKRQPAELKKPSVTPKPETPMSFSPQHVIPLPDLTRDHRGIHTESVRSMDPAIKSRDDSFSEPISPRSGILSSSSHTLIPAPKPLLKPVDAKALEQLLQFVAEGEQDKAEALIKKDQNLLLHAGTVTDLSGREFKGITAFQYALWALDWHIWTMIKKYLPLEAQAEQFAVLESKGTAHEKHFSLQPLTGALQTYVDNAEKVWKYDQRATDHWCKVVGGAQKALPAHVVNEYCRSDRPFEPCPQEWESRLPRTREMNVYDSTQSKTVKGSWYVAPSSKGGLGLNFAFCRYNFGAVFVVVESGAGGREWAVLSDLKALQSLWKTRTQQLESLKSQLLSVTNQSQVLGS